MILLFYVIVGVITIVANTKNYNINIPEDRHMDIRVRRHIDNDLYEKEDISDENIIFAKNLYEHTQILLNNELVEVHDDIKIQNTKFGSINEDNYKDFDKRISVTNGRKFNEITNDIINKIAHTKHNINSEQENSIKLYDNEDIKTIPAKKYKENNHETLKRKLTRSKRQYSNVYYDTIFRHDDIRRYNSETTTDRKLYNTYSPYKSRPNVYYNITYVNRQNDSTYNYRVESSTNRNYIPNYLANNYRYNNENGIYNYDSNQINNNTSQYTSNNMNGQYNNNRFGTNINMTGLNYNTFGKNANYGPNNSNFSQNANFYSHFDYNRSYNDYIYNNNSNNDEIYKPNGQHNRNNDNRIFNNDYFNKDFQANHSQINVNLNHNNVTGIGNNNTSIENNDKSDPIILQSCFLCKSIGCPKFYKRIGFSCVKDDYDY
ncbi:probable serine/threonine-protein kinase clkA [Amyelois transitella]|uniref:probable serine/threonine-protein kinase clkA n=1 Tax=Amyelois transitella TaxID=680683 RepID=UPI00298F625C|nr:probable serine/threonine-protein kinase clkA [Amyelois transitella]